MSLSTPQKLPKEKKTSGPPRLARPPRPRQGFCRIESGGGGSGGTPLMWRPCLQKLAVAAVYILVDFCINFVKS